jgi:hypothetical protein
MQKQVNVDLSPVSDKKKIGINLMVYIFGKRVHLTHYNDDGRNNHPVRLRLFDFISQIG